MNSLDIVKKNLEEQDEWLKSLEPVDDSEYLEHLKALSDIADTLKKDYELALANSEEAKREARSARKVSRIAIVFTIVDTVIALAALISQFFQ